MPSSSWAGCKPTWGPLWASSMSLRKDTWQHSSHPIPLKKTYIWMIMNGFPKIDIGVMSIDEDYSCWGWMPTHLIRIRMSMYTPETNRNSVHLRNVLCTEFLRTAQLWIFLARLMDPTDGQTHRAHSFVDSLLHILRPGPCWEWQHVCAFWVLHHSK